MPVTLCCDASSATAARSCTFQLFVIFFFDLEKIGRAATMPVLGWSRSAVLGVKREVDE